MIRPFMFLLALAGVALATASEADAQSIMSGSYSQPSARQSLPGTKVYSSYYSGPGVAAQPTRLYPYSYYTLSPLPPRTYVGYKTEDFAFRGVAYGHPYDPWTWPMMSGYYTSGLSRYYDPPVK